jgi:hypothetical protein
MSDKDICLGLTAKEAKIKLSEISKQIRENREKYEKAMEYPARMDIREKLDNEFASIAKHYERLLECYNVGLLESLNQESKRLNILTIALIGLTVVLTSITIGDIILRAIFHV